ncbi:aspartate aminotransferase family protein [Aestuariivirga sp.]|uniref:aspartate aminotransferase family protein n=1 Tax=Aestuariivirga sp. TaxID=2650926 RepID=UPI003BA9A690
MARHIPEAAIKAMLAREEALFTQRNPTSKQLSEEARQNWLKGVPMHWMVDWGTPFPLFVTRAEGVDVTDADGNSYVDFCLGDTGAMFGHSPPAVVDALQREGAHGLTTMMPSPDAAVVGRLLEERFGLPCWQVTATASDANRAVIKWCRAISGRKKILVFNHCYHGAVDDTYVTIDGGTPHADPALIGEVRDLTQFTKVVEFNDIPALEAALAERDVACVLAEPIMTNVGMVLPDDGYHAQLREITRRTDTLLVLDETHCMSSGPGGYTWEHGLQPDALVLGKPIAGGIPAAVYGFSQEVTDRIRTFLETRTPGHSGIGTTLSGSKIQLALMRAVLENYFTEEAFGPLIALARRLEKGIADVIIKHGVPWHAVRAGARVEFMCTPERPRNGGEAHLVIHRPIDEAVHHYLLNRGVIVTPFHNMMLICPATTAAHVDQLVEGLDRCLHELMS